MRESETCHFWVGHVPEKIAENYFVEIWDENDPDREHTPLSAFAKDQGVTWYDHDFLEYGWGTDESFEQLAKDYSYSEQWGAEIARRIAEAGLNDINFFAFISDSEIENPKSVQTDQYWLHYIGTVEYRI